MKTIWKMVPGLAMALVIAAAAKGLEYLEGLAGLQLQRGLKAGRLPPGCTSSARPSSRCFSA